MRKDTRDSMESLLRSETSAELNDLVPLNNINNNSNNLSNNITNNLTNNN